MSSSSLTDEFLITEIQKGNIEYFKILVERYENKIFSMGMRFFYNSDDAEDFVQEVFLKLYSKLDKFRGVGSFKFWFYKVAYNHAINIKKSKGYIDGDVVYDESMADDSSNTPESVIKNKTVKKVLLDAIEKLPERYRVCLDFYFFMGLKYSEISEITNIPINTIKSDVLRAKKILREYLKGTEAEV